MYPADLRSLTGLRIVAAAWVLVYHFRNRLGLDLERFGLIAKGYLGIDLFFILSGFILSHVYLKAWSEGRFRYGSFLWARLARLYPVHLLTLDATIVLWAMGRWTGASFETQAFDPAAIPQHLMLIHAWWSTPTVQWNFPSWSISAEWFAYLLFPAAAVTSIALRARPVLAVALAIVLLFALDGIVQTFGGSLTRLTAQGGALRIVPSFAMGVALHRLGATRSMSPGLALLGTGLAVGWIVLSTSVGLADRWIWPGLAALIFCLAETDKAGRASVLAAPLAVYLGEVSYAVYMTHLPVDIAYFEALDRLPAPPAGVWAWAAWLGVLAVCLFVSVAVYHAVERPAGAGCGRTIRSADPQSRTNRVPGPAGQTRRARQDGALAFVGGSLRAPEHFAVRADRFYRTTKADDEGGVRAAPADRHVGHEDQRFAHLDDRLQAPTTASEVEPLAQAIRTDRGHNHVAGFEVVVTAGHDEPPAGVAAHDVEPKASVLKIDPVGVVVGLFIEAEDFLGLPLPEPDQAGDQDDQDQQHGGRHGPGMGGGIEGQVMDRAHGATLRLSIDDSRVEARAGAWSRDVRPEDFRNMGILEHEGRGQGRAV
ncbi:acyltransferase family protein [Caulobacter vibrioides]|jgi:peptidoglycan/LPS O-acetylase OafA/YrhL|uniref:Putative acyltransferase n=1 Tax=Caulobacter vibrioides OR37 TaxID=1292034 RepID=R0EBK4_CAUVI|nr:acyltransferase [Caulobacter vibrioides]ENZ82858.1 putative acyltransferase [Caulobacter vibrioides OR37]